MSARDAGGLRDGQGRTVEYLRLSVTDRCDLRCTYCLPPGFKGFAPAERCLTTDEIIRIVGVFAKSGVSRVRLTGGEPLVRRDIVPLASRIAAIDGITDLSLSTNGTQLARFAAPLRRAGVTRLNVSLDSLDPARFHRIARRNALPDVLQGLAAAEAAGFAPIKLNMVVMHDTPASDIDAMVEFCAQHGYVLRFIETMPIGDTGRGAGYVDLASIRARLQDRYRLVDGVVPGGGPARYLVSPDRRVNVGFITPVSQHFCATCNRVRLSADGRLHLCLGQEHDLDLRALLRRGAPDDELAAAIRAGLQRKPARHEFNAHPGRIIRVMAQTGG